MVNMCLDDDKAIRKKYAWMNYVKNGCLSGMAIDLIMAGATKLISSEFFGVYLPYFLIVFFLVLIMYIFFFSFIGNKSPNLLAQKRRQH